MLLSSAIHVSCQLPSLSHRCLQPCLADSKHVPCGCLLLVLFGSAATPLLACMHVCVHVCLFAHWPAACQWLFPESPCCCFTTAHGWCARTCVGLRLVKGLAMLPQLSCILDPDSLQGFSLVMHLFSQHSTARLESLHLPWTPAVAVSLYCSRRYYVPHAAVHSPVVLSDPHVLRCVFTVSVCSLSLFVHNHRACRSGPCPFICTSCQGLHPCLPFCLLLSTVYMQLV